MKITPEDIEACQRRRKKRRYELHDQINDAYSRPLKKRNPYNSYNYRVKPESSLDILTVRNRAGVRKFSSGYSELAINEANQSLNNGRKKRVEKEKVQVDMGRRVFSIGSSLEIETHSYLEVIGRISLADSVNDSMLKNTNTSGHNYNIIVEGGVWEGNRGEQTAGNCIDFENSTQPPGDEVAPVIFRHLTIKNVKDNDINIDNYGSWCIYKSYDVVCKATGDYSLYLYYLNDSHFYDFLPANGIYIKNMASCIFDKMYVNESQGAGGDCWDIDDASEVTFANSYADVSDGTNAAFDLEDSLYNTFSGLRTRCIYDGDAVPSAFDLDAGCEHNVFDNIIIGRMGRTGTRRFTYGIYESASADDYNIYGSIEGSDCVTAAIYISGSNSTWDADSILGGKAP